VCVCVSGVSSVCMCVYVSGVCVRLCVRVRVSSVCVCVYVSVRAYVCVCVCVWCVVIALSVCLFSWLPMTAPRQPLDVC
jgi:hypothetical protein